MFVQFILKFDIKPIFYLLEEKNNYQLDLNAIFSLIESDPLIKIFVLNSPSNPLGIFQNSSDINKIVEFCFKKSIEFVFCPL